MSRPSFVPMLPLGDKLAGGENESLIAKKPNNNHLQKIHTTTTTKRSAILVLLTRSVFWIGVCVGVFLYRFAIVGVLAPLLVGAPDHNNNNNNNNDNNNKIFATHAIVTRFPSSSHHHLTDVDRQVDVLTGLTLPSVVSQTATHEMFWIIYVDETNVPEGTMNKLIQATTAATTRTRTRIIVLVCDSEVDVNSPVANQLSHALGANWLAGDKPNLESWKNSLDESEFDKLWILTRLDVGDVAETTLLHHIFTMAIRNHVTPLLNRQPITVMCLAQASQWSRDKANKCTETRLLASNPCLSVGLTLSTTDGSHYRLPSDSKDVSTFLNQHCGAVGGGWLCLLTLPPFSLSRLLLSRDSGGGDGTLELCEGEVMGVERFGLVGNQIEGLLSSV